MRSLATLALCSLVAVAAGCGGDDDDDRLADAGPDDTIDPGAVLFDPDHLVEVEVELPTADWDELRHQTRGLLAVFGGSCGVEPYDSPFTFFPGDVAIDGETVDQVGLRKKGFLGSLDAERPSLVVDLDRFRADASIDGLDRLTFNNSVQDTSLVAQCLAYATFDAVGVPAPRCNFAHVTVNGANLGLYVHVETPRKTFLRRHFDDPDGTLYEGTLADFRPGWEALFDPKTAEAAADPASLTAVSDALAAPDDQVLERLDEVIDLDAYLAFWAAEEVVGHWDGYAGNTNNFFVYDDPADDRLRFVPWGTDGTFGDPASPTLMTTGALAHRLYEIPAARARLFAALEAALDGWDEDALHAELERMAALIEPVLTEAQAAAVAASQARVATFIDGRRAALVAAMAGAPAAPPLRDPLCFSDIGTVTATLTTTFGTLGGDPFVLGDATPSITLSGGALGVADGGAVAGDGDKGLNVTVAARLGDGTVVVAGVDLLAASLGPGTIPIDDVSSSGYLYVIPPAPGTAYLAGVLQGELTLSAGGTTDGAAITGSLDATVEWFD